MHSLNRNSFLKDLDSRALVSLQDPFNDVVLTGYLYDPIDCIKPMVTMKPGKVYRKDNSFLSIILLFSIVFFSSLLVVD